MKKILMVTGFTALAMSRAVLGYCSVVETQSASMGSAIKTEWSEIQAINGSRVNRQCPNCPRGPQGPAGAAGATGPTGATGALNPAFGNFATQNDFGSLPGGRVIPFDLANLHTADVELVSDQTFNIGATAVAIDLPGTYLVTFGLIEGFGNIELFLNNVPQGHTLFLSDFSELTTIISVDAAQIAQGQNGAALLEIIAPKNKAFPGALSEQQNPNDLVASLTVIQISANPAGP